MTNAALASFLIGLREGLEGTLVVSILVAYLVKAQRSDRLVALWCGVTAAVLLSVAFAGVLTYTDVVLGSGKELFDAVTSIAAVVFVTWMIFWMRRTSRRLKGDLTSRLDGALRVGGFAVVGMAFLAVAREGLETALLFFASAQGATTSAGPLLGLTVGVATSVVVGFLLYRAAVRINLATFFTWTGVLLVLVAAGIFKYGVHDFQEAGILPGLSTVAFDVSSWFDPTAWYAALMTGMFNFTAAPTGWETIAWVAYVALVLPLFLLPGRPVGSGRRGPASQPGPDSADAPSPAPAARA